MSDAEEIVRRYWRLEMREHNDDPGHWYPSGEEFDSLQSVEWYRYKCWRPRFKNAECRIVRFTTTRTITQSAAAIGRERPKVVRRINPNRFVIGERVLYRNHVTGENLGLLEIVAVDEKAVTARKFFGATTFTFQPDGAATWSCNLSIAKPK